MSDSDLFETGIQIRRDALGREYVDQSLTASDDFMMTFQRVVTELAWGYAWSRPGLDRKTRFMINIAMLTALGRWEELTIYSRGALAAGITIDEIQEILIQAIVYCGTPAGRQAFLAVDKALDDSNSA